MKGSRSATRSRGEIDDVVASYTGELEIDNLESAALPSKRAVIEAFNHLAGAHIGFYATRSLNDTNLRHTIAEHSTAPTRSRSTDERALTYDH